MRPGEPIVYRPYNAGRDRPEYVGRFEGFTRTGRVRVQMTDPPRLVITKLENVSEYRKSK